MKNSTDPSAHRACERRFIEHVERLLKDERLRIDTTRGRRPVTAFAAKPVRSDAAEQLKRQMIDMRITDRDIEQQMPVGESLEVELKQAKLLLFTEAIGKLRALCISPTKALLSGSIPEPLTKGEAERTLAALPPTQGVPTTLVILSTSGFTLEAHELAERRAERTLVLVEPNVVGGFSVYGPVETKALSDLFDPEAEDEKRSRIRDAIDASRGDLTGSGIATDRVVARTKLPLPLVEAELKEYARQNRGLVAKRLDGRIVLFQEGSVPISASTPPRGGSEMPMIDRIKSLFARKGETEKKISFLSERRAALGQQRDRAYEELAALEQKDAALVRQFKESNADVAKRRVTTQLVQLRKEMERRQQLLSVFNQQINVVSTHLHNLELVHQGKHAKLPDSEEMASDAAKAEEMLASLQANHELAESVGTTLQGGLNAEEQALYAELSGAAPAGSAARTPSPPRPVDASDASDIGPSESVPSRSRSERADPEAG
ncbi:MAG TPA: hypothetical protein VGR35_02225 [Tepidisphaeraceae bacterium]|nr:hypothetical protein [Tepidisphaeraceae bacterium]